MDNKTEMQIGPALAIVIIIGMVALAGIFFYKNMIKGLTHKEQGYTVNRTVDRFENQDQNLVVDAGPELSTSTDLESIEADLDATLEADLSILDELDEQLFDFEDLEDFDFEI